jgi:hypothetical protein
MNDRKAKMLRRTIPWTGVRWLVGTAIAAAAVVAGLGGPEDAWLQTRTAIWGHPPPKIVSVAFATNGPQGSYIVTLRNPALEDVLILGYRVGANRQLGVEYSGPGLNAPAASVDNGAVTVMGADERTSNSCDPEHGHYTDLPRPLIIEARGARALQVRPYKEACWFNIAVLSDHGESNEGSSMSGIHP